MRESDQGVSISPHEEDKVGVRAVSRRGIPERRLATSANRSTPIGSSVADRNPDAPLVIPAQAGNPGKSCWMSAFAGMTGVAAAQLVLDRFDPRALFNRAI